MRRQIAIFPHDREPPAALDCEVVQVRLRELGAASSAPVGGVLVSVLSCGSSSSSMSSGRGTCWRADKGTRWLNVFKTLVFYQLIDPGSEWRLHRQWYEHSAMSDVLGEGDELVQIDKLYRCLDKVVAHKREMFSYLRERWQSLFNVGFEVLLYDLTST